jgi:MFS transporter, MHS family, shikimate and dehydroshikimate transport protein
MLRAAANSSRQRKILCVLQTTLEALTETRPGSVRMRKGQMRSHMTEEDAGNDKTRMLVEKNHTSIWRVVGTATAGTLLEWYDYFIYGTAAALLWNKLFFPNLAGVSGLIASYSTFAIGFAVRPIGALVLSNLGDRIGRKPVLVGTLWLMGLSSAAIGFLPTYASIGGWAPALLIFCRVIQGLGVGAQYSGAIALVTEYAPARSGLFGSFPAAAADFAILCASGVFALVQAVIIPDQFLAWGWRVPFMLALVGLALGQYLRSNVEETPEFLALKAERRTPPQAPIKELIRDHPRLILAGLGASVSLSAGYLFVVWSMSYVTVTLGMSRSVALSATMIASTFGGLSVIAFGALSDRVGWRPIMLFGAICAVLVPFPMFWLFRTKDPTTIYVALTLAYLLGQRALNAVQPKFFHQLFPARLRFSGIALSREPLQALLSGPMPFIATALTAYYHGSFVPVAWLMVALPMFTIVTIFCMPRTPLEQ